MLMHSDINDVYAKGILYSKDPDRIIDRSKTAIVFAGDNSDHSLHKCDDSWACDCACYTRFALHWIMPLCAHLIAIERILGVT